MMKKLILATLLLLSLQTVFGQKTDAILGKWMNPDGKGEVQIYKKGNLYFGRLVWLKFPVDEETGKSKLDKHNPDAALRLRPELGLEILKNFTFNGDNGYEGGTIYDPKNGETYSCKMTLDGDRLKIRGYIGISLLGRNEVWARVK